MNLDAAACPKSGGGRIFSCGGDFYGAAHKATTHELFKRTEIEKDIDSAIRSVDQFAKAIDRLTDTLEQMYQTPNPKDVIGEKSFPIRDGRYRVFFKITANEPEV